MCMKDKQGPDRKKAARLCKRLKGRVRLDKKKEATEDVDPLPVLDDETDAREFIAALKKRKGQYDHLHQRIQRFMDFMLGDNDDY